MRIAAAQVAPRWLDREGTTQVVLEWIQRAAEQGVEVLAFGETFLPGYPFWLQYTGGARFEDREQQAAYAAYLDAAVDGAGPELRAVAEAARRGGIFVALGVLERGPTRGSVFASAVAVHPERGLAPSHRKLVPTHEERLVWAPGDGHGLRVHEFRGTRISLLNCWENWMPVSRHVLWAQGSRIHVALWPGNPHNTEDITRFVAREGRVYALSASTILRREHVASHFPLLEALPSGAPSYRGGSCVAGPDGRWVVEPVADREGLVIADVDPSLADAAHQSFDAGGHYFRADVFDLRVDRRRRVPASFRDHDPGATDDGV
jgi:nitrilase